MATNILDSVSSKVALGDEDQGLTDDPAVKKIYQGSTVVYENAHAAIANNSITHPWWEADTQYPGSQAKVVPEQYWNGHQSQSDFASIYTDGWGHYSPLFTNTIDYQSYMGRMYLYRFNTKVPGASGGHSNREHVDLARCSTGYAGRASTGSGIGATAQKRILKMHGAGAALSTTANYDVDRTYPSPPITSCTTDDHPDIDSNLSWAANSGDTRPQKAWYYNQYFTSLTAPDSATQATFGCYVRVPSDDMLRDRNGGCVQLKQIYNGQFSGQQAGKVDNIIIRKDSSSPLTDLKTGSISNLVNNKAQAHYQWSGPQHTAFFSPRGINNWNDQVEISAHQFVDAADISEFTKVSRTVSLNSGTSRTYNFSVGFLESHSYLVAMIMGQNPLSGSVQFYNCFVVFS